MASGAEIIRQIKERIEEVDPREVHDLIEAGPNGTVVVDVREQHEFEESHLPGAKHVPRGHLESRIETAAPDKSKRVILYCQSGNRSALAARHDAGPPRLRGRRVDDGRHHALEGPRLRGRRARARSPPSSARATRATC